MAIDLTGGIDPAREQVFARRPDDPEMRDSVSFWVVDDRGEVGLPRIGIEAVAANWDAHDVQVNVAFPDGRVFRLRENGQSWPAEGPDGRPTVLGAGGLGFRCIEPFDTWTMTYDGKAVQTSSRDLIDGKKDGPLVDVSFHVEADDGGPAVGAGRAVRRGGVATEDLDRGQPDGRRRATSSCSARRER